MLLDFLIGFAETTNLFVDKVNNFFEHILFFKVFGLPFLLWWVLIAFVASNFVFKFVSIRLLRHSVDVIQDKFTSSSDPGTITHSQAVYTEALSTLGLGSIAGVAIAIATAGPGALLWLVVASLLGTTVKFAEVSLAHKYRVFEKNGIINGGPFLYIQGGLKDIGYAKTGRVISIFYAIVVVIASAGASTMSQTNQTVMTIAKDIGLGDKGHLVSASLLLVPVFFIVFFGLRKITRVADYVIPFMTIFYVLSSALVLVFSYRNILPSLSLIWHDAFHPKAAAGGLMGSIAVGLMRAMYSTTSGSGTSSIAHAPSKTREHIREGCASFMDVFLALLMCIMTGLVIVVTGAYERGAPCSAGIDIAKAAFATIHPCFAKMLTVAVFLFAFTTIIGWSYYGSMAWIYLCGDRHLLLYKIFFMTCILYAAITENTSSVLQLCDYVWTMVMIPNLLSIFLLAGMLRKDLTSYIDRWKHGMFISYK